MAGDSNDKYCLRWNAFGSNLEVSFQEFRTEQVFFDVTVVCEDGQLGAHKAVLSAGSPLFRQILRQNPHTHPLLYLRGLTQAELAAVLDFMYLGEVSVRHTNLERFLALAEDFKVKGLIQGAGSTKGESGGEEEEEGESSSSNSNFSSTSSSSGKKRKRRRTRSKDTADNNGKLTDSMANRDRNSDTVGNRAERNVKTEPQPVVVGVDPQPSSHYQLDTIKTEAASLATTQNIGEEDSGELEESYDDQYLEGSLHFEEYSRGLLDQTAAGDMGETNLQADIQVRSKMVESADGGWQCSDCHFLGNINRVYKHIETNHVHVAYFCETCNKRCKTRNSLFCHRYRYHRTPRPQKPTAIGDNNSSGGGGGPEPRDDGSDIVSQYARQFKDTPKLDLTR